MGNVGGIAMPDLKLYHVDMALAQEHSCRQKTQKHTHAAIATRFLFFHI